MKVYLVYAKDVYGQRDAFVSKIFSIKENAEEYIKEQLVDSYLFWIIEQKIEDS